MILITQTLLSGWLYTFNCPDGLEDEAWASFMDTLNRVPTEPNEAMQNGIRFENGVYALAKDPNDMTVFPDWLEGTKQVADVIRGGQFQVKVSRPLKDDDDEYLIYGICDAVKAGQIYDVKFSTKAFHGLDIYGKYLHSPQHPAYLYCMPEAYAFTYLVSDGKSLYREVYTRDTVPNIVDVIRDFRRDLRYRGLDGILQEKWRAKE